LLLAAGLLGWRQAVLRLGRQAELFRHQCRLERRRRAGRRSKLKGWFAEYQSSAVINLGVLSQHFPAAFPMMASSKSGFASAKVWLKRLDLLEQKQADSLVFSACQLPGGCSMV